MLSNNTITIINGAGFKLLSDINSPVDGSFVCTEDNIQRLIYFVANHCLSCVNQAPENGLTTKKVAALIDKKIREDLGIINLNWQSDYLP